MHCRQQNHGLRCPTLDIGDRVSREWRFPSLLREPDTAFGVLLSIEECKEANMGRGILLWLLGVPIPVIILLWLFFGR
jgi:hypothetical protein